MYLRIDAFQRAIEIMSFSLHSQNRQCADVLLMPDLKDTDWTDFPDYKKLVHRGEKTAEYKIKTIHEMLNYRLRKKVIQ